MEARPQKRWLCNELVHELCLEIPTTKTSDRILLTAHKIYAYLAPGFSKKLIYRDAIAFLKSEHKKNFRIRIDKVYQNNESEQFVVNNQVQSEENFVLETSQFRVHIWTKNDSPEGPCSIMFSRGLFMNAKLHYFLRLITPWVKPIQLYLWSSSIPIDGLIRFMDTQRDWIDWIALWDRHLNLEPIFGALKKYNKLEIYGTISLGTVPKLVGWLTMNNCNGQPYKHLFLRQNRPYDGLALLIEELKKEFATATSERQFFVGCELCQPLDEFTLCNELTGEKLQLRSKNIEDGWYICELSRFPSNELIGR